MDARKHRCRILLAASKPVAYRLVILKATWLDLMIDVDMSTTYWVMLPQRNVNCFAAPLHSAAADRAYIVCMAWDRLGRRDNHDDRFASPAYLPCITACTLVLTHSPTPLAVFCRRRPLRAVQMVIMWTASLTDQWTTISHRVSRPKKILPDTDTTQYMQISPNTR